MSVFVRRTPAPSHQIDYTKYRTFVREDFQECCAYCLLHEALAAGVENFELDHFRPKAMAQFAERVNDFYNLYYACHVCNNTKGVKWPSEELENQGFRFVDLCAEEFSEHFREEDDGAWTPLTKPGEYSESRLRLNRKHLKEIRSLLRQIATIQGLGVINWDSPCKERVLRLTSA